MSDETIHPETVPAVDDDRVGYDPETETFHARFDGEAETVTLAVVETVAAVTGREFGSMTPLFHIVDPEALSALVETTSARPIAVSFSYEGCCVTVSNDGTVVVEPPEEA